LRNGNDSEYGDAPTCTERETVDLGTPKGQLEDTDTVTP
jgi:hypothetical protein